MLLLIIDIIYCYLIFSWFNPICCVPSRAPTSPQARENAWDWDGTGDSDPSSPPRIKGDDEPKIVSWRVLEGVTEPFNNNLEQRTPAWKLMKAAADSKAKEMNIQQALHEYGQLLRHPYMFGEMPIEERYDVFLTMSRLLKLMGFHQRAELLLYEAMSYTSNPYEAHLQLGILFLDKEDLNKAKMHFKNCLFFKENDILILAHLTVILVSEGKMHEAKFFLSRILIALQARVDKISFLMSENEKNAITNKIDSKLVSLWIEDLMVKVFYGEFRITPAATVDMYSYFSNMYQWIASNELMGRFLFDLGQALYEGGRPKTGRMMMELGYETSDPESEGFVSSEVVKMRLNLDFPAVPESLLDIVASYLNVTKYLSETAGSFTRIDVENVVDVYWPVPLVGWSGLPMQPVLRELMWRFDTNQFIRKDEGSQLWIRNSTPPVVRSDVSSCSGKKSASDRRPIVKVGILGGHLNNHPVGRTLLHRVLGLSTKTQALRKKGSSNCEDSDLISVTLLVFPLIVSSVTTAISAAADRVLNLPSDSHQAWRLIGSLHLDVLLFPDWQPFPDQQSVLFQSTRIAPVQICLFIRGVPCPGDKIDYYLMPEETRAAYLKAVPAADLKAKMTVTHTDTPIYRGNKSSSRVDEVAAGEHENPSTKKFNRSVRPAWMEVFPDQQVLLVDWPLMTRAMIQDIMTSAATESASSSDGQQSEKQFSPLDIEGQVFFDGQPVAILPVYPSQAHPLMDEVLFKIMRTVPELHLVLVLPDCFYTHTTDYKNKISWARKLVRRLWTKGGNLYHRIRLLPSLLSDDRLLQMLRQADMVFDTFPLGSSLYFSALAVSVGTPVVTMESGTRLKTPSNDLKEIRTHLMYNKQRLQGNPMAQYVAHFDVPWMPCVSSVSAFYNTIGLAEYFVANSTSMYFELATSLASNREFSYGLRVRLLDAVDKDKDKVTPQCDVEPCSHTASSQSTSRDDESLSDLRRVIRSLGGPWAELRDRSQLNDYHHQHHHQQQQQQQQQEKTTEEAKKGGRRARKKKASSSSHSDVNAGKITLLESNPVTAAEEDKKGKEKKGKAESKGGAKGFFNFFH